MAEAKRDDNRVTVLLGVSSVDGTTPVMVQVDPVTGRLLVDTTGISAGAPVDATYITQTPNATLSNEQALSLLATGIMKNTTATGVVSIATAETDYVTPTGAGTLTNKTLTTPTIGSFTNSTHNHTDAAGGGQLTDAALSTAVTVAKGGTGNTTFTAYSLICAGTTATGVFQNVVGVGTLGQILTSNGAGALPSWETGGGGSGTVTTVSVVSANGFAGSVANAATTPAITLTTTLNTPVVAGNGTALIAATVTGSGSVVLATSPTLATPVLGVATATSINKVAITAPATSATLTIADGKTATVSNTLTFTGTDASSVAFGAGGTVAYTNVATLSSLTSVGTIGTGVWQGTAVGVAYGGTGNTTFTAYSVLCAGTTSTGAFQNVSGVGTSGQVLTSNGAALLPTWQAASSSSKVNVTTSNTTVTNTTLETTIYTATVPGGTLGTNNGIIGHMYISALSLVVGRTATFRLKYGGTTIATIVFTNSSGGTLNDAHGDFWFKVLGNAATNAQEGSISGSLAASGYTPVSDFEPYLASNGTAAVDSTADQTLLITEQTSGAASAGNIATNAHTYVFKIS